ncbi:YbjN domain-containing protein [uncultured Enterovirga sp.]|uniref:YbjN domain-containing protein n=1 Tax=uncultured Enterovirga sp. TaxID=2026352 RepID=UPI0035CB30DB
MKALPHLTACLLLAIGTATTQAQVNQLGQGQRPAPTASGEPVERVTVEQVAKLLQDSGYRAEIVQGTRNRYIRSGLSGRRIAIYMYDCKEEACGSFQFSAIFVKNPKYTLDFVNAWNKARRYAKAYLDNDGDLNFEWDIDLDGGVTNDFLKTTILSFENYLGTFDKFTP